MRSCAPQLRRAAVLLTAVIGAGCREGGPLQSFFHSESPYEQYLARLRDAGLEQSALGRDWVNAGEQALARPVTAQLPFRETGYFSPQFAAAIAYQLELRRGRRLAVEVSFESERPARWFVDLFRLEPGEPPRRVASLIPDSSFLAYEVRHDGSYLLRLQPELLRGGRYTVVERTEASLGFPVPGSSTRAVRSGFGAEREGGARSHQGIDIFAPRGTPVVAVADGMAQPSTNQLGGNVVWLHDAARGRTYYYAHLEAWAAGGDGRVKSGDTLGYIGNTGNARTTPPHLHFGIYDGGAFDPLPFLQPDDPAPPWIAAAAERLDELVRVRLPRVSLRSGPQGTAPALRVLEQGWVARVSAASRGSFRLSLPDQSFGYVDAAAVTPATAGLRPEQLAEGTVLRESPSESAPAMEILQLAAPAEVLGRFAQFELVRLARERVGWVRSDSGSTSRR